MSTGINPHQQDVTHLLVPSVLLCASLLLILNFLLPWIRRRQKLIEASALLPGTPVAGHPHPWLADTATILNLPSVPGRPALRLSMPWFEKQADQYSSDGLVRMWAFNPYRVPFARCFVLISDPDLAFDVLGPQSYGKFDKGRAYDVARPLVGDSLLALSDGPEWKVLRKLAAPGFSHAVLERTTEIVARITEEELFPLWDDEASLDGVDVGKYMCRFTLDVLCEAAFSYSFGGVRTIDPHTIARGKVDKASRTDNAGGSEEGEECMYQVYETIKETLTVRARNPPFWHMLPLEENRRCRAASAKLDSTIEQIVQARLIQQRQLEELSLGEKENVGKERRGERDLLAQLLLKDGSGTRLSQRQILGNVRMFLFAGHDTTSASLSYALWHLAKRPNVQDRLHEEVAPLFHHGDGGAERAPTYAELRNLPYLDAVLRETLRLHAPAGVARRAKCDVTIGGRGEGRKEYVIPEGCGVFVFPSLVSCHPRSFGGGDPGFDPDRFLCSSSRRGSENGRGGPEEIEFARSFIPFSVGPRNCVGQQLAMAEMRAFLAHVVHRYTFEPAEGAVEPLPILTMTVSPHEVMVRFRRRVSSTQASK